jgi:DNA (cytosine-5)-methyltransferase 1
MNLNGIGNNNVDTTEQLPTVISFCSGYGGIERGLDLAGFEDRVIAYVEIEAYAIANLANKMEAGKLLPVPIWSNLKSLPVQPFRDKVDLITGGYPCQPFSAAGQRKGTDDPRHLWPYIKEHIRTIRPLRVFFENVEGHISLGLREVIVALESLGYERTWGIFSAREVGAPHQRKRVYILADSKNKQYNIRKPRNMAETSSRGECGNATVGFGGSNGDSRFSTVADPIDKGLQGRCRSRKNASKANARREGAHGSAGQQSGLSDMDRNRKEMWPPEPRVGRVVDGCPDRVDRIRMLGNGVVPQTAGKAWVTLNSRLNTTEGR